MSAKTQIQLIVMPGDHVSIPEHIDLQDLDLTSSEPLGPGNKFCYFSEFLGVTDVLTMVAMSEEMCDEITNAAGYIVCNLASGCGLSIKNDASVINNVLKNVCMLYFTEPDPEIRAHRINCMIDTCDNSYTFEDAYIAIKRGSIIYEKDSKTTISDQI